MTPKQKLTTYCAEHNIECEIKGRFPDLDIELSTPKGFIFGFGSHYSVTSDGEWAPSGNAMYEAALGDATTMIECTEPNCEYCNEVAP